MRRGVIKQILVLTVVVTMISGCSHQEKTKGNKVSNGKSVEQLYAADNNATTSEDYQELLMQYKDLQTGDDIELEYDFNCKEYTTLVDTYNIKEIAGEGSEFERAVRLMDHFAPKLTHQSNYDNHIEDNSLALLQYSLDNPNQGINCRAKTKILNEMCLALGIYARRVWLMPYSSVDMDCHVVSEIYDTTYNKWIMIDMTTDTYFVNKNGLPLSVLEVRECWANGEFCTSIDSQYSGNVYTAVNNTKFANNNTYFMKNLFYIDVQKYNGFGNKNSEHEYVIAPENYDVSKRESAYIESQIQYSKDNNMEQNTIDKLRDKQRLYEEGSDFVTIISPSVMREKPN